MRKFIFIFVLILISSVILAKSKGRMFDYLQCKSAVWSEKEIIETKGSTIKSDKKVYFKGDRMRIEKAAKGKKREDTIIITPKFIYVINEKEKTGIKMPVDEENMEKYAGSYMDKAGNKMKKTGSGKVAGKKCDIYEYKDEDSKVKFWKEKKSGFIMKQEVKGRGTDYSSEIYKLKKNVKVSDSKFKPGKDIEMTDYGNMMKHMNMMKKSAPGAEDMMKMFGQ